jgi:large-conductance mechanosensitive channel
MDFLLGEIIGALLSLFIIAPFIIFLFVATYTKPDKDENGLSG